MHTDELSFLLFPISDKFSICGILCNDKKRYLLSWKAWNIQVSEYKFEGRLIDNLQPRKLDSFFPGSVCLLRSFLAHWLRYTFAPISRWTKARVHAFCAFVSASSNTAILNSVSPETSDSVGRYLGLTQPRTGCCCCVDGEAQGCCSTFHLTERPHTGQVLAPNITAAGLSNPA